jgi:hypothetical protein
MLVVVKMHDLNSRYREASAAGKLGAGKQLGQ